MINENDIKLLAHSLPFWQHLSQIQKELLIANTKSTSYSKGQSIHCGDTECIGVLIIQQGTIRTFITSDEGREITLYRLDKNDVCILSASCVLQYIDFDVSVEAETDCRILQINSSIFSKLSSDNVYVELFSYKLATERFSDVMWAMQQILFISFDKRLAGFLLDECFKQNTTQLHMTHEEIAKYLGTAREVVSRMLKYFAKENLVLLSRGTITIPDKKKLQKVLH